MRSAVAACLQQLLAALLQIAVLTGPGLAQTKHALLVGVNAYEKRGFRDLFYAERDVDELEAVLQLKSLGYQVTKLTGSSTDESLRATLANIKAQIDRLLTGRTKQDLVLIGLAGHGFQLEVIGSDGKIQADAFYCPVDAERGNPSTMLSIGKLLEQIDTRGGGRNLLLIDACREDPTRGRGLDGTTVKTLPEGVAVMFGCGAGQKTYESKNAGGGHGIFFHYVIEGLKGGAKNDRGEVTWSRLSEYVTEQVVQHAPALLDDTNVVQEPNPILNIRGVSPVLAKIEFGPLVQDLEGSRPGEERADNGLQMVMCWIPPGQFKMGSPASEEGRSQYEQQVDVTISRGFWMGKHEVTQGEWQRLMGSNTSWFSPTGDGKDNVAGEDTSRYPVETVSAYWVQKFCSTLANQDRAAGRLPANWEYRLPTEAEWEYACRAGTMSPFHFGSSLNGSDANANGSFPYGTSTKGPYLQRTCRVGSYAGNAWGLRDMHGNVWEWCQDSWDGKALLPGGRDPLGKSGEYRVSRGGSWIDYPSNCRSAYRNWSAPDYRGSNLGFRLVRGPLPGQ